METKLKLDLSGSIDRQENNIANNFKAITQIKNSDDKNFEKLINFIDNFETIMSAAVYNKLNPIVSELTRNSSQIKSNSQLASDRMDEVNIINQRFNQQLSSNSKLASGLTSKLDEFSSSLHEACRSLEIFDAKSARLENELKSTRNTCNDLMNTVTRHQPNSSVAVNNAQCLQLELSPGTSSANPHANVKPSGIADDIHCSSLQQELLNTDEEPETSRPNLVNVNNCPTLVSPLVEISNNSNNISHFSLRVVAPPKNKDIFVSRFITSTTHLDILSHIRSISAHNNINVDHNSIKCKNISRLNGKVASFKITVPETMFDLLMSPSSWPISTFVKEFTIISNDRTNHSLNKTSKN